ncbi:MAG: preprotein translocase subunit SecE [Planctomycetaceae bacterium]|nr:preprotein translocase subunit SecE [Planctomycetales bacterium]MCB9921362.1 preprotein translocase subunit SecE [Planctomycetaceae bacterium]
MSKQKTMSANSFVGEIFHVGLYKPSQGRVTRQVTCAVLWTVIALASLRLYQTLYQADVWQYVGPMALLVAGFWAAYRAVNYPRFADFLIAVEAEMNKVSWPSKGELIRSSVVVIFVIFMLAVVLFGYDVLWQYLFKNVLGVLK